ncbi:MAG: endonuclease [Oscillospiraceae bacterium]|nr:endonuclease [Oscillospiraceae bacterium]
MKPDPLQTLHDTLLEAFGDPRWWPADSPYEVMLGAVLTQNTAWRSVERSLDALRAACPGLDPRAVAALGEDALAELIRPSGFAARKAQYIRTLTAWFAAYGFAPEAVQALPLERARAELLALRGVGRETADSILLYAFGFPTFVVDAYTVRLASRLPLETALTYEELKGFFEARLPREAALFNRCHALIVRLAQRHCRKSRPLCGDCPLRGACRRQGVDG